jgi:signal transduction histidine kinase
LDEVWATGRILSDSGAIVLAPNKHELIVRFSVAYWGDPANLQLAYQLTGVQDEWYVLDPGQRELRFLHLPFGEHTLTVRKLGASTTADSGDLVLHFTVRRPFYLAAWFLLLCGGALTLLGILIYRIYQGRLRKQNLQLTRMVRARTGELQAANERLHRSIAVKERLVSIISHDIVTPLRFIARVAHKVPQQEPEQHRAQLTGTLHDIALSSDKLYMNARNLLNWIKHQGGHIELRPVHVALNPLVEDAVGVVARLAKGRDMLVINSVPYDDVLLTDRDLLGIVLQNLLNNALNHSQGSQVIISGEQLPDAYCFTVSDDGPGLPAQTMTAIERLRAEGLGDSSAMLGLGYMIITELVRLMGGELRVEPGPGARITVLLTPLRDAVRQPA